MADAGLVVAMMVYAYLVGSIPTAYLVARWVKGIDIRRYGSGNMGSSNVTRNVGRGYGVFVGVFDALVKGTATVALARTVGLDPEYQALAALFAVAGHNWSLFFWPSGGRALSVIIGSLMILAWKELLALLAVAAIGFLLFRGLALWVGIALILLPVWATVFGEPAPVVWFCVGAAAASVLKRLLSNPGTAPPGLRWRDMAIPRLLFDRDTIKAGNWVARTPDDEDAITNE
ncbi:MAG: glycerol-3-phosphate acyltransferase [Dehalococcoidia bacterium]